MRPLNPVQIVEYVSPAGDSPFGNWFDDLDAPVAARVAAALARLAQGSWSHVKGLGDGVHELRLDVGPGYRVYFGVEGANVVILLAGGSKARQQADIGRAKELWRFLKRRGRMGNLQWH